MRLKPLLAALVIGAGASAASVHAAPADSHKGGQCFYSRDWAGWRAPNDRTIILRVRLHDYYQVDLSNRCPELLYGGSHIINIVRGSDMICGPLDLDIRVAEDPHFSTPCLVKSLHKLSPTEVAAIPKKSLP